ncbi:hypothetical protein HRbin24_01802 [bacterium HR24]|nr:hypothetical protein HRbin24_01802 [bacterium HR24]
MAGAAAALGDYGGGALHGRHPVGGGHGGDQHVALLDLGQGVLGLEGHAHRPAGDARAAGVALGQDRRRLFLFLGGLAGADEDGDGAGLEEVEAAVLLGPLDVLGAAVVLLHLASEGGQIAYLVIVQLGQVALVGGHVHPDVGLPGGSLGVAHQLAELRVHALAQEEERRLVHNIRVGGHRPRHYCLAQAVCGLDYYLVGLAGDGLDGEYDPGAVRLDHALHGHGDAHLQVVVAVVGAIEDGAGLEQGRPALLHRPDHRLLPFHVEEGRLLASEGRLGRVLGGSGAAHGHGPTSQPSVGRADALGQLSGHGRAAHQLARLGGGLLEGHRVVGVESLQHASQLLAQASLLQKEEVSVGGHDEGRRHRDARSRQLAQVGALAAG